MELLSRDPNAFIRPSPSSGALGGVARRTREAMLAADAAGYDIVIIETVGVGQSETDIALAADTVVFCVQPGSGDSLQFMKAGIVEIPDIVAVTKGDMGKAAVRARADMKGALELGVTQGITHVGGKGVPWNVSVQIVSANAAEGIDQLMAEISAHWLWLADEDRLAEKRHTQAEAWLKQAIKERWGREGLKRLGQLSLATDTSPFGKLAPRAAGD